MILIVLTDPLSCSKQNQSKALSSKHKVQKSLALVDRAADMPFRHGSIVIRKTSLIRVRAIFPSLPVTTI
jgi:hypothetical protein